MPIVMWIHTQATTFLYTSFSRWRLCFKGTCVL